MMNQLGSPSRVPTSLRSGRALRRLMSALTLTTIGPASVLYASGPIGAAFTYQGRLEDGGFPANGQYDLFVRLMDGSAGNNQFGATQCFDNVEVVDGLFTIELDFSPAPFQGDERWLDISVRPGAGGACGNSSGLTVLAPRQRINATPYALYALNAGEGQYWIGNGSGDIQKTNTGDVGINVTSPTATLDVENSGGQPAIQGKSSWIGVLGTHLTSSGSFPGVYGETFSLSSFANGVRGVVTSTTPGPSSAAVRGINNGEASSGIGVYGSHAGAGWGVYGEVEGGRGVYGRASATTGTTYGVYGSVSSPDGYAGYFVGDRSYFSGRVGVGTAPSTDGMLRVQTPFSQNQITTAIEASSNANSAYCTGLDAQAGGASSNGLFASGDEMGGWAYLTDAGATGFYGQTLGAGAYGVAGSNNNNGWGVYSFGKFGASGTKSFRIDHPLDPANRYLTHYSAEGPEPQNIYNGMVTLDENGSAWVELPDYFASINRDPRYQLTCIGQPALVFIAQTIDLQAAQSRFQIAGGKPNMQVSWQVSATRNDAWVRTHGAPVEVEKVGAERGRYQHPELFGMPADMGMHFEREQQGAARRQRFLTARDNAVAEAAQRSVEEVDEQQAFIESSAGQANTDQN